MKVLRRIGAWIARDIGAAVRLPWRRFMRILDSFGLYVLAILVLYLALVMGIVFVLPSRVIESEDATVFAYVFAPALLVELAWGVVAWIIAGTLGSLAVTLLSEQPLWTIARALGESIARITTWTGRISMPVLLASLASWVLSPSAGATRTVLQNVALLQIGMLFISLTFMVCFEAVNIVFRKAERLPWSVRIVTASAFALTGWFVARRIWHLQPTAERIVNSLVPTSFRGVTHEEVVSALSKQSPAIPWLSGVVFATLVLLGLIGQAVLRARSSAPSPSDVARESA